MLGTEGFDGAGVEVLSAEDLEHRARDAIRGFDRELLLVPRSIPVERIAEGLAQSGELEFEPFANLEDALGECWFRPPRIRISSRVSKERRRFVIAHEFGHFILHRKLRVLRQDYVSDDDATVFGEPPALRWMEWQANRFASAFLMPSDTIAEVLKDGLREVRHLSGEKRRNALASYAAAYYDVGRVAAARRITEIENLAKN